LNLEKTVHALALALRANHHADDEGNKLVQETTVSQEAGFHERRGAPWADVPIYGSASIRDFTGKAKGLRVLQTGGCRGIGIHGILIIEDY
jgi:hypothetical protein